MNHKRRRPARCRTACGCVRKYAKNHASKSARSAAGSAKRLRWRAEASDAARG